MLRAEHNFGYGNENNRNAANPNSKRFTGSCLVPLWKILQTGVESNQLYFEITLLRA